MIYETKYWQHELKRLAQKLHKHRFQKRWLTLSDSSVEKCIMLGFYSIRKLLKAFDPPPDMNIHFKLITFPRNKNKLSTSCFPKVSETFDLKKPNDESIKLYDLCNIVIHSYYFNIWLSTNNKLKGIFVTSDHYMDKKVYRMEISNIIELFEQIATSHRKYASGIHFSPDNNHIIM